MMTTDEIRTLADAARDAQARGDVAGYFGTSNYAAGVEDALRYVLGDAAATDDLRFTVTPPQTCHACGNDIAQARRPLTGQVGWAEDTWGDDRDWQCGLSATGSHALFAPAPSPA
jgi:hypothetical protein